jgi:hypothetical protein
LSAFCRVRITIAPAINMELSMPASGWNGNFEGVGKEHGRSPSEIVASHIAQGTVTLTRPLCPYPMTAHYTGHGSTSQAANFSCRFPDN